MGTGCWRTASGMQMTDRLWKGDCHIANKDKYWQSKGGRVKEESLLDTQMHSCWFHRRALGILSHIQYIILKISLSPVWIHGTNLNELDGSSTSILQKEGAGKLKLVGKSNHMSLKIKQIRVIY